MTEPTMTPAATGDRVAGTGRKPMSVWRLEWLRLVRTRRLVGLAAVYLFFGLTSPPLARYLPEILEATGSGGITVLAAEPRPLDGIGGFTSNTVQVGLLVFAFVVASALAVDAHREMAVFLRTRVPRYRDLLLPKYVTTVAAGGACFLLGTLAAWYGTVVWLGALDPVGVVVGAAMGVGYLAFVGAVAAVLGTRLESVVATAVTTLAVALVLGIVGSVGAVGEWLPSDLPGALPVLATGGDVTPYLRSVAVTVAATGALLALAARLGGSREL